MAEGVLLNIAQQLLANLASEALNNTKLPSGVKSELRKLEATLSTVKAVLVDAEEKRHTNNQVKVWLDMLEDAVYDADNLVEEFRYEELRRKRAKNVRLFFSSSNHVAVLLKICRKVRKIREKAVLDVLLDCGETKDSVSVIPIVGIGGLGKTTPAQLVFNDEEVQKHFERRIWVCVANVFDVKLLVEKIIRSFSCESSDQNLDLEQLQNQLRREIQGRRFLLVLDDVWNEDSEKWLRLERLLRGGVRGSGVLITTRNEIVAKITKTVEPYMLKGLDEDKSWTLFQRMAFEKGKEPVASSGLMEIGKEILDKCKGVPLAIKTVGRL